MVIDFIVPTMCIHRCMYFHVRKDELMAKARKLKPAIKV